MLLQTFQIEIYCTLGLIMIIITMIMKKEGKCDFFVRCEVFKKNVQKVWIKIVLNVSRKMLIIPPKHIFVTTIQSFALF